MGRSGLASSLEKVQHKARRRRGRCIRLNKPGVVAATIYVLMVGNLSNKPEGGAKVIGVRESVWAVKIMGTGGRQKDKGRPARQCSQARPKGGKPGNRLSGAWCYWGRIGAGDNGRVPV